MEQRRTPDRPGDGRSPAGTRIVTDESLSRLALEALLDDLLIRIRDALAADTVVILLTQPGDDDLHAAAVLNFEEEVAERVRVPLGRGFAGTIAATGKPLVIEDLDNADVMNELLRRRGLKSLLGVPLHAGDDVIGVLHVGSMRSRSFTEDEIAILESIGERIALAIARARAHEAERQAHERLRFLAEASHVLASSLDYERTLAQVGELVVPRIADWYSVTLLDGDDLRVVAVRHADAEKADLVRELLTDYPPHLGDPRAGEAVRTGRSQLMTMITDEMLRDAASDERHHELLRALGFRSAIFVPLAAAGRTFGALTFITSESDRVLVEDDLRLAEDIGRRAAVAIENARLHRAEQEARARAELLQGITTRLAQARTQRDVAEVLVREGAASLGASAGWIALLDPDRRVLDMVAAVGYSDEIVGRFRAIPIEGAIGAAELVEGNRPTWARSADEVAKRYPHHAEMYRRMGFEALAVVPLVVGNVATGFVAYNFAGPRDFDDETRGILLALAAQCAQALERARLYDERAERANASVVLANVDDGVLQVDESGTIRLWNRAAEHLTGIAADDAVGRRVADVFGGWEATAADVDVASHPGAGRLQGTVPLVVGGEERWLAISGVRNPDGTVYAFRDLTGERALERARRDFLATASHELRTPLGAVYGAALTLAHRELAEEQRDVMLRMIVRECERLTRIVDDLLLANNLDLDHLHVDLDVADGVELVREVVALRAPAVPEGMRLEAHANGTAVRVACDRERLRQVLVNLVDNAIKYSPDGGTVHVGVDRLGSRGRFIVTDEGIGIPASEHERIFEKFYRLDPHLSRGVGGSGLGLYISRELVRRMDGRIDVESEPGRGSRFTVELPLAASA